MYLTCIIVRSLARPTFEFYLTRRYKWVVSITCGIFVYLFLVVFLPFGVDNYNPDHEYSWVFLSDLLYLLAATVLLLAGNEFLLKPLVMQRVRIIQVLGWTAWLFLVLGSGNFLVYNWLGNWHDLSWGSALSFILNSSSILVFPLTGVFFYFRYETLKDRVQEIDYDRSEWQDPEALIHFHGEGKGDRYSIAAGDFRFAQAQDNYVALHYVKNGVPEKELIRSTLGELMERTSWEHLVRCHRSYAVNLTQVRLVKKGHPMLLHLKDLETPVRVSRAYRESVLKKIESGLSTPRKSVHPK